MFDKSSKVVVGSKTLQNDSKENLDESPDADVDNTTKRTAPPSPPPDVYDLYVKDNEHIWEGAWETQNLRLSTDEIEVRLVIDAVRERDWIHFEASRSIRSFPGGDDSGYMMDGLQVEAMEARSETRSDGSSHGNNEENHLS
ncbi:hypothetical protein NE237_012951 [Protea cynaroides]|uniref:Uncharacterized protein n=1 Tax=Protea cynaroides TaxID=273540 RepID=A0A9Q0H0S3_9MAGN|nr:hypothetical protein NE237_012951 [Protea cynaroides]